MFILCVWLFCLYLYMDTMWGPVTLGGQKKALDFSELGFQMVLSHQPNGCWDPNQILCKSNKCFWWLNHLSSPSSPSYKMYLFIWCVFLCVLVCVCEGHASTMAPCVESEDKFWESVLFCYHVGSGDQTQVVKFAGRNTFTHWPPHQQLLSSL